MTDTEIRSLFADYDLEDVYQNLSSQFTETGLFTNSDVACMEDFLATYNYQLASLSFEGLSMLYMQFTSVYSDIKYRYDFLT